MTGIDTNAIRARSARALSSFPTSAFRTPLHDQLREALADVPALLDEAERLRMALHLRANHMCDVEESRAEWADRAEAAEAECDRLRAQVEEVRDVLNRAEEFGDEVDLDDLWRILNPEG